MEITDFLTNNFLATFTGTLFAVELIIFSTKNLPLIKKIPTRVYTFIMALSHIIIINSINGSVTFSVGYFYGLFINALVITAMLCGGYDVIIGKINLVNDKNKSNTNDNTSQNNTDSLSVENDNEESHSK